MSGTEDHAHGTWDATKGRVKETVGDLTDDQELRVEGKVDQVEGKAEQGKGHLNGAWENLREAVRRAFRP